ncbi:hypothetical protein G7046_g3209 [Stylonectria norvegica]|nr:hypothetical protein G7046_g3209 [Stylonectria norvegica]
MDDHLMSRESAFTPAEDRANQKSRACSNCARLKMKCQWPGSGVARPESSCLRCSRMKLACSAPEPTQRKKRGKSTRVAQLEKKIDGIVSLLAATQNTIQHTNQPIQPNAQSPLTPESPEVLQAQREVSDDCETCVPAPPAPDLGEHMSEFELLPGFRVTRQQATEYLAVYRTDYLPKYPFVPIPADATPYSLYNSTRFLFWGIMAVVMPLASSVQQAVKVWIRRYLANHMIIAQEKRLEFLQGILLHIGWNDFHFYIDMQATNLLQLGLALVFDLRLDKPPNTHGSSSRSLVGDAWATLAKPGAKFKTTHTSDEKRAVLGYLHISCLVGALFRRGSQLQWNSYMSQCCDSLLAAHEYETDIYLTSIIKLQHIASRIYSLMPGADYQDSTSMVMRAPLDMAINNVRRELDNFVNIQPESVRQMKNFMAYYHVFRMRLYEPVLLTRPSPITDPNTLSAEPFHRYEALWNCLQACSDYLTNQLSISPAVIPTLPFTNSALLGFSVVTTTRLLLLESSPDWDSALARKKLDFAHIMKTMSEQFEETDRVAKDLNMRRRALDDGSAAFLKYSFKMRWISQWYLARQPPDQQQNQQSMAQQSVEAFPSTDFAQWGDFQFDESFWQELMSVYEADSLEVPWMGPQPTPLQEFPLQSHLILELFKDVHHLGMASQKRWRDWVYLIIVGTQLFGMLVLDLVPFYPKSLWHSPSAPLHFLTALRTTYVKLSGDPFFAHAVHAPWFHGFLYVEGLAQLPLAAYLVFQLAKTRSSSGTAELAGLASGCLTAMGSVACCFELWEMGPDMVKDEQKAILFYGTYLPFAVIPAVMAVDMYLRLLPRVRQNDTKAKTQ